MSGKDCWQLQVMNHGSENQPVVVIDAFVSDPHGLREDASFLSFSQIGEHYPGIRAVVPEAMLRPIVAALAPVVRDVFGLGDLSVVDSFYSLVTTPPDALAPIQRLPHFDEVSPTRLALLHYLADDGERSDEDIGGTAFFRQRSTGYESVDAARLPAYRAALADDLAAHGIPNAGYIGGDSPMFERVARHTGRFNRAILYRSNTLHCADIPAGMPLSADPFNGRLTVNTFLDAVAL
ncbi:DUF6445 family protein [Sphingomonas sp. Mn802worker]|uniref:DUF6445 family protein n=1 Tax=Sphingomonas sp. Mn802worker TaxID=629773 RepID=UPI000371BE7F|nr:DUF6445 family protein [Sphingomonas sp. Mn802worker]